MERLFAKLMREPARNISLWNTLFEKYGNLLDATKREQCLQRIQATFEPEDRRLLFDEILIPDLYSDENAYLMGIARTDCGFQELCSYLRLNVNCFPGWRMLFFEFTTFLTPELEEELVAYLKQNVSMMVLEMELPEIFPK